MKTDFIKKSGCFNMKMNFPDRALSGIISFYLLDLLLAIYIIMIINYSTDYHFNPVIYITAGLAVFVFIRTIMMFFGSKYFVLDRVRIIKDIIEDFKKGRFITTAEDISGDDEFSKALKELIMVGKHLDNIVSTQRNEIDTFHELYNSMVFSISSYFIVLNEDEKVVYANEAFCKKFKFDGGELPSKALDEIFYFVNARLKGGIAQARNQDKPVVLERIHLLSVKKVSIISDVKIIKMLVQGRNQIIIIIDDITGKLRKDYQISIMSQISESIQQDVEIERVLFSILTGVTSGSGLGFNRAQLFLVENDEYLSGKMAVGPDSFEEAIDIWSSVSTSSALDDPDFILEGIHNQKFLERVLKFRIPLSDDNILTKSLQERVNVHIFDSWNDSRVDDKVREFVDVKEFVIVPIIAANRSIGLIIVDNKFNQIPIGEDSIELLTIFASQAALSIESHNSLIRVKEEMQKIERRQDAIVESEKMAAVGRIAAHISHEIRNPLVTMGGYARRIFQLSKDAEKNAASIKKSANIILNESERLEKILSNVMDFTRPSKYIKEFNNINDIILDTIDLLKNLFLERKIEVRTLFGENLPLVKSDGNQMKQVVLNLLQNAIDVSSPGDFIEVETLFESDKIIIKVRDTGSGIDEEDPNIVFEPFFTTKVTGVGLGLANVKKIIMDHNGIIDVANRSETGVEFRIELPCPA